MFVISKNYFLIIFFIFTPVIINTIINQANIHITSGVIINISPNLAISELGHTLKSSIICKRVVIHKNCTINASYDSFFDTLNNNQDKLNKINDPIIELNQIIPDNINKPDNI